MTVHYKDNGRATNSVLALAAMVAKDNGRATNSVLALAAMVAKEFQGQGLSATILGYEFIGEWVPSNSK